MRRIVLFLCLWMVCQCPAFADGAAVCKDYFAAVQAKKFGTAWSLLSSTSKSQFVHDESAVLKQPEGDVRKAFDTNGASVQPFWNQIREAAHADLFVQFTYSVKSIQGNNATVRVVAPTGKEMELHAFQEKDGWKFGLLESAK